MYLIKFVVALLLFQYSKSSTFRLFHPILKQNWCISLNSLLYFYCFKHFLPFSLFLPILRYLKDTISGDHLNLMFNLGPKDGYFSNSRCGTCPNQITLQTHSAGSVAVKICLLTIDFPIFHNHILHRLEILTMFLRTFEHSFAHKFTTSHWTSHKVL